MLASALLQRVQDILQDTTSVRWPEPELLRYLNDAQREIVLHKPDASSATQVIPLVAGTRQAVPNGALRLLDVVRNMGADGETPGNVVTLIGRGVLDAQRRGWHAETPAPEADHYVFDLRAPKTFYVYPPAPSTPQQVEAILSIAPDEVTAASQAISLDDIYANVIMDYILYRSYGKDADFAKNLERALVHYQAVAAALGLKSAAGMMYSPRAAQRDTRDGASSSPPLGG